MCGIESKDGEGLDSTEDCCFLLKINTLCSCMYTYRETMCVFNVHATLIIKRKHTQVRYRKDYTLFY